DGLRNEIRDIAILGVEDARPCNVETAAELGRALFDAADRQPCATGERQLPRFIAWHSGPCDLEQRVADGWRRRMPKRLTVGSLQAKAVDLCDEDPEFILQSDIAGECLGLRIG